MTKIWNQELDDYLSKIHQNKSNQEIANLINNKFDTNFTKSAINSRKKILKLISNYKYRPKYSQEIIDYIKKIIKENLLLNCLMKLIKYLELILLQVVFKI